MRLWLATVALLAGTAFYVVAHPPADLARAHGALAACPAVFGEWNGTDLSFENAVVEELDADDLLVRRYRRGAETVWLCMIYHQNRRFGAHDPHLCYRSQGYLVDRTARASMEGSPGGLSANRFVATRGADRRVVIYWWTTEGLATADADAFRGRMAVRGALDNRSWGAFVRVEAQVQGSDLAGAERAAADFASHVARALPAVFAAGVGAALQSDHAAGTPDGAEASTP